MAFRPTTSWQIEGEKVELVTDFLFMGSKITADGECSHEIRRRLLVCRKAMTNFNSVLKSRGITLPTKVHTVKAMVFPVVMYGCESWTEKKVECFLKNWCLKTMVLQKTPESPLDSKEIEPVNLKGNQLWIFIGRTDTEAETPVVCSPAVNSWLLEKSPMLGKIEIWRRRGHQRMRCLDGITDAMDMNLGKFWEMVRDREAWHATVHGDTKSWKWLGNWTTNSSKNLLYSTGNCIQYLQIYTHALTYTHQFSSVQSLSRVLLFATP